MELPKVNISSNSSWILNTVPWNLLLFMFISMSLWVVDGDEFLQTYGTWIWIFHGMTCIVSLLVVSRDKFLVTQGTYIRIFPSMTLDVLLLLFQEINHLPHRAEHTDMSTPQYEALCVSSCSG